MKQKLWCCIGFDFSRDPKKPDYWLESLAKTKEQSILRNGGDWETYKKRGWKCIKVEVTIKPINEVK